MEHLVENLIAFIHAHAMWAIIIIGLIAFAESLLIVGMFIPATAIMIAVGALVGGGALDPWAVLASAIVGAILGDLVSYEVGRRLGPGVIHRPMLRRYRDSVAAARLFFMRYGTATVFVGRFLGPLRATAPLVAGMLAMNGRRFQFANVTSAIVWAPAMMAPGWLAARGMSSASGALIEHIILVLAGLVTLGGFGVVIAGHFHSRRRRARRDQRRRLRQAAEQPAPSL